MTSRFPKSQRSYQGETSLDVFATLDPVFRTIDSNADIKAIYSGKPYLSAIEPENVVKQVTTLFNLSPESRPAALDLISKAVHEYLYLYNIVEKDRNVGGRSRISQTTNSLLAFLSDRLATLKCFNFPVNVFRWSINLLIDANMAYAPRHFHYKCNEATEKVFNMAQGLFDRLVGQRPAVVVNVIVEFMDVDPRKAAKLNSAVDVFLNLQSLASVEAIFEYGALTARQACLLNQGNLADAVIFDRKLIMFCYFALRKRKDMVTVMESILDDFVTGKATDNFKMIFLIKFCCFQNDVFEIAMRSLVPKVTREMIIKFCNLVADPYIQVVTEQDKTCFHSLLEAVENYKSGEFARVLDVLQPLAYNSDAFDGANVDFSALPKIQTGLKELATAVLSSFLRYIHETPNKKSISIPAFDDKLDTFRIQLVKQCLLPTQLGEERRKLLFGICNVYSPSAFSTRIFAFFLCMAQGDAELKRFVLIAVPIIAYHPTLLLDALRDFLSRPAHYAMAVAGDADDLGIRFTFLENLRLLMTWTNAAAKDSMDFIVLLGLRADRYYEKISLMELTGDIVRVAVNSLLMAIEDAEVFDAKIGIYSKSTMAVIRAIQGVTPMEPGLTFQISKMMAAVYVHTLRLVKAEAGHPAIRAILDIHSAMQHLFTQKFEFSKAQFMSTLVREVMLCTRQIFGSGKDLSGMKNAFDIASIPPDFLPSDHPNYKPGPQLLAPNREVDFDSDRGQNLVQAGSFKQRTRKFPDKPLATDELTRNQLFLVTVDHFLFGNADKPNEVDIESAIEVAHTVVDVICHDRNLTTFNVWEDWFIERSRPDHVDIVSSANSTPVTFGLQVILSLMPFPVIFCLAPILKSQLAVLINHCAITPMKDKPLPEHVVDQIDRFFLLLSLPGIAAHALPTIFKIISRASAHEAGVILTEIWAILVAVKPNAGLLQEMLGKIRDSSPTAYKPAVPPLTQLYSYLLQICQRNLEKFVDVTPEVIDLFPPEAEEDNWDVTRLHPVLPFNDIMRR